MSLAAVASLRIAVAAVTIAEINGNKFLSPLVGQTLANITGLVTAKGPDGVWIRSTTPDDDVRTSESIYVYSSTVGTNLKVGDIISLGAKVDEYRSADTYLYLTELSSPKDVKVLSSGNQVSPLIIGEDTLPPPTVQYTSLDGGDIYAVPNAVVNISAVNPVLDPANYGLDFWESLVGELVTIRNPRVIGRPSSYRDTWVVGDWPVTGKSSHGSLTMSDLGILPSLIFPELVLVRITLQTPTPKPSLLAPPSTGRATQTSPRLAIRPRTSPELSPRPLASTACCLSPGSRSPSTPLPRTRRRLSRARATAAPSLWGIIT